MNKEIFNMSEAIQQWFSLVNLSLVKTIAE